jgi:hypothetical protein
MLRQFIQLIMIPKVEHRLGLNLHTFNRLDPLNAWVAIAYIQVPEHIIRHRRTLRPFITHWRRFGLRDLNLDAVKTAFIVAGIFGYTLELRRVISAKAGLLLI